MKRDLKNKMIFGVCAGLANEFKVNPAAVRLAFAVLTLMGFGLPILVYLVLALIMSPAE